MRTKITTTTSPYLYVLVSSVAVLFTSYSFAQTSIVYPRITGYFSETTPIGTLNKDGFIPNFKNGFTLSFPFGINILKSDHFGVSFEVSPSIRTEKNVSKVSTIVFHPGAMFRFARGFTFISRVAFETSGRFGVTPVFNKVIKRNKNSLFFISIPVPIRFGNNLPASVGTGLQVGVGF